MTTRDRARRLIWALMSSNPDRCGASTCSENDEAGSASPIPLHGRIEGVSYGTMKVPKQIVAFVAGKM